MRRWKFYWSPEGRLVDIIEAETLLQAKLEFKRRYPAYAKYMGEVGWEEETANG